MTVTSATRIQVTANDPSYPPGRRFAFVSRLLAGRLAVPSIVIILVFLFLAIFGGFLSPYDPLEVGVGTAAANPSLQHPLGTDNLGRDLLSRLIEGTRPTVVVGIGSVLGALLVGVPIGLFAGYFRGFTEYSLMRMMDALYAFPALMLVLSLIAVTGRGLFPMIVAISIINVPIFSRILRAQVLSVRERDFVLAATAMGASSPRIVLLHILPNSFTPILVQATILVGYAILAEASLNFLGLGIPPPDPTWGGELQSGFKFIRTDPLLSIFPGLAIFLLVLSLNIAGDALRDAIDPRLRGANE